MKQIVNVITPAAAPDLLSLDEAKLLLNIPGSDTSKDALIAELITNTSDVLAVLTNRVFVKEKVQECFFGIDDCEKSLYFSRWPVKFSDITSMSDTYGNNLLQTTDWILQELSGTLFKAPPASPWQGTVVAVYSGGYIAPDEVPPALKHAALAILRDGYYASIRGALLAGVRMIAHKHARVMYYPPGPYGAFSGSGTAATPQTQRAIDALLYRYVRHFM
jgi:hypothetical protein